mmetsp:Transcript_62677/g.147441  ORF Transcript_62677/g.147441 Transcript_62677/m.147441 type:complete len:306 (-) Transcript_62677:490-1407(-)
MAEVEGPAGGGGGAGREDGGVGDGAGDGARGPAQRLLHQPLQLPLLHTLRHHLLRHPQLPQPLLELPRPSRGRRRASCCCCWRRRRSGVRLLDLRFERRDISLDAVDRFMERTQKRHRKLRKRRPLLPNHGGESSAVRLDLIVARGRAEACEAFEGELHHPVQVTRLESVVGDHALEELEVERCVDLLSDVLAPRRQRAQAVSRLPVQLDDPRQVCLLSRLARADGSLERGPKGFLHVDFDLLPHLLLPARYRARGKRDLAGGGGLALAASSKVLSWARVGARGQTLRSGGCCFHGRLLRPRAVV